jgi:ELWxxDGT repeat protein
VYQFGEVGFYFFTKKSNCMKKLILFICAVMLTDIVLQAQVTQINANKSLETVYPINNNKAIAFSKLDSSIWVTDGSLLGTIQISNSIKFIEAGMVLNGQLVFIGNSSTTGVELFITDGTNGGTMLLKDISLGTSGSDPGDFALLNGFIYFSAVTANEGRELWKTNGTSAGTSILKDIVNGVGSSNQLNQYNLFSNGSYLLFAAQANGSGMELWKSDGTDVGTSLLFNINTGNGGADSSNPANFYAINNTVVFTATDATHGNEFWRTDGTSLGTFLLKDVYAGTNSSTSFEAFPGFLLPYFSGFHTFNNKIYFQANDGISTGKIWSTDGTIANTVFVKDIVPGTSFSFVFLVGAVNLPNKFIFSVSDGITSSELWESDGTSEGTNLFKSFNPPTPGELPIIYVPYNININTNTLTQPLFQGDKFFFTAGTANDGYELWISNGTLTGTAIVKDINPGVASGIDSSNSSYLYTSDALFFSANNGINGLELWKTNGAANGTSIVADIVIGSVGSDVDLTYFLVNGKVIFKADDGDYLANNIIAKDLYSVDGTYSALPIGFSEFSAVLIGKDAILKWGVKTEGNNKEYVIERSFDGLKFDMIGKRTTWTAGFEQPYYTFTDANITDFQKNIVYYRIMVNTFDDNKIYSPIVPLKLKGNYWNVRFYPNPVLGDLRLAITGITGPVEIAINDAAGRTIYRNQILNANGGVQIPANKLPHGYYVLVVMNGQEKKSIKFIR